MKAKLLAALETLRNFDPTIEDTPAYSTLLAHLDSLPEPEPGEAERAEEGGDA